MDEAQARDRLDIGLARISAKQPGYERRTAYYKGNQDLPYAPEGVNAEYLKLREQAVANWLALAMDTPIQRLRAEGFRTGRDDEADVATWNEVWQPNKLDSRQRIPYTDAFLHGRGLMSVWPNQKARKSPLIRPENGKRVHLEPDPDDPWTTLWSCKTYTVDDRPPSRLILPAGVDGQTSRQVGVVYDDESWFRFERGGMSGSITPGAWSLVKAGANPLEDNPFVAFDNRQDADGEPTSALEQLMPQQDAINTIRFQTLLAMQFSAYRQRVFTGYDPVLRDEHGAIVPQRAEDGTVLLDANGQPLPIVTSPGRVGVDRALVFPGADTKVFDMPESNLSNYISVLTEFLTDLFATGQVPPQYLLNRMSNLSSDTLTAAESTLQSLISDLKRWNGESVEQVMRLANRARGEQFEDLASEVIWAETETKQFAVLVDGIVKLVSGAEFPVQAGYELLPGATPQKVERWLKLREDEQRKKLEDAQAQAATDPILQAADRFRATPEPPAATDSVTLPPQATQTRPTTAA
ncbi:SPP1 Gp6-like portal protein [Pseudonocardia sediminis]|uniref:SPP1 Gp6-like portal protein n=1 Tax=Pseudonocardia sediminis TaxID=1397368 RepID=A0A4Q7V4D8_PSEST|nr:phage portal protein [Pseudonocardia sediminis]RZT87469.1 SPP1 Gp6-like portal protein [Pseudonocardia sediminis]